MKLMNSLAIIGIALCYTVSVHAIPLVFHNNTPHHIKVRVKESQRSGSYLAEKTLEAGKNGFVDISQKNNYFFTIFHTGTNTKTDAIIYEGSFPIARVKNDGLTISYLNGTIKVD